MTCEALAPRVALYAEGELHDRAAIEDLRQHLATCRRCAEALRRHDELTAQLLAADAAAPDSRRRAGRIAAAIAVLPRRAVPPPAPRLVLDVPPPAPVVIRRPRRWALLAAAAAALIIGIPLGMTLGGARGREGGAGAESLARMLDLSGGVADASEQSLRRWVLDEDLLIESSSRRPTDRLLRLYGVDLEQHPAPGAGGEALDVSQEPGLVIDAMPRFGERATRSTRFYLIHDSASDAGAAVIEIDPRSCFRVRDLGAIRRQASQGKTRLYRVVALPAPGSRLEFGPLLPLEPAVLPGAGSWRAARGAPAPVWIVPASW